ncbi:hypothetical protein [Acetobacter fallax]|uniref:Uncharacterized protein n=1 Tax=Acetobacter fallax TaxID=1737473 RepID=A0ABX0KGN5_9PROT|nr:hypothetical protein [Acetobacter fallax]NHO33585.1 hypothetical protein [Acetobacter fallax]NHO37169.1 hypothetical protein [Acetobacter fallax]
MDYDRRCDDLSHAGSVKPEQPRKVNVRKLSLRLLAAVHYACDIGELEIARTLLALTEETIIRRGDVQSYNRRRIIEDLASAYERWWKVRQDWSATLPASYAFASVRDMLGQSPDEL